MKAISLWQPWAAFIPAGIKKYETRSWATPYRGPIAIHASSHGVNGFKPDEYAQIERLKRWSEVREALATPMVFGAVLCICELTHCWSTESLRPYISPLEASLGNFADGRTAWELEVVEIFDEPIPCKGKQGLWEWQRPS
jgi:activating signal cointegrator 1